MNSTHEVPVVPVKLEPHPDPETTSLSVVSIFDGGYTVVVRTEDWLGKSIGAYIQPDSVVGDNPIFDFLGDKKVIKARKLRGVNSFGLLVPAPPGAKLGDNVANLLGVTHYEPPLRLTGNLKTGGEAISGPKGFYPKFDVESGKKYHKLFEEGESVFISQKIHGCSGRYLYSSLDNTMYCGSRTEWKAKNEDNLWWKCFYSTPSLEKFCMDNPNVAVYGELWGAVQDMKYNVPPGEIRFSAFDILRSGSWMNAIESRELGKDLPWVPTVSESFPFNLEKVLELAEGDSLVVGDKPGSLSEGIVCKPLIERNHPRYGRVCLKFVSLRYLERKVKP